MVDMDKKEQILHYVGEDGLNATASINGNTMKLTNGSGSLTYTKYNGTPQQLMDYLNK